MHDQAGVTCLGEKNAKYLFGANRSAFSSKLILVETSLQETRKFCGSIEAMQALSVDSMSTSIVREELGPLCVAPL